MAQGVQVLVRNARIKANSSKSYPLVRYPLVRYPLVRYPLVRYPLVCYPLVRYHKKLVLCLRCSVAVAVPGSLRYMVIKSEGLAMVQNPCDPDNQGWANILIYTLRSNGHRVIGILTLRFGGAKGRMWVTLRV